MKKTNDKEALLFWLDAITPRRSAWGRGVKAYAEDLADELPDDWQYTNAAELERALLNGADDWRAYSYNACALVFNADICERLSTPSEIKKFDHGAKWPSGRESWLDVQERALFQAYLLLENICRAYLADGVAAHRENAQKQLNKGA